jgi:hypothetical protein
LVDYGDAVDALSQVERALQLAEPDESAIRELCVQRELKRAVCRKAARTIQGLIDRWRGTAKPVCAALARARSSTELVATKIREALAPEELPSDCAALCVAVEAGISRGEILQAVFAARAKQLYAPAAPAPVETE